MIRKAFKFELMPNGAQIRKMKQFCGCSRFVFNKALAYQNEQYQQHEPAEVEHTEHRVPQ